MQFRQFMLLTQVLSLAGSFAFAQETTTASAGTVIRTETRLVLVDAVVTDKKGNYVRDLTAKDFRVWEDNKEQEISTFSFEADAAAASKARPRYLVLFFDNSTLDFGQQAQARQAAVKFIAANAGPNRLMAIVNYGGSLQIAQNFTDDVERLKQVASGLKMSAVASNSTASAGGPSLTRAEQAFGVTSGVLALRSLVKNLATVPGRKSLVLLTGGFRLNNEMMSDITALIDTCNKSNVAIYPIDVRGLVAPTARLEVPYDFVGAYRNNGRSPFQNAFFQVRGGGAAGGGAAGGGGATGGGTPGGGTSGGGGRGTGGATGGSAGGSAGGRSGATGGSAGGYGGTTTGTGRVNGGYNTMTNPNLNRNNPLNSRPSIVPRFPESASTNQQPLYMLASGTGGFVIVNTNDLEGGLEKIGKEQNEYYMIGYTPSESADDSCHSLKVKVDKSGTTVRARTGYCNVRPQDVLAGNTTEKDLEKLVAGSAAGTVSASIQVPYFYTSADTVRANVAMEIPTSAVKFEKRKGKYHAVVNILGIAYRPDGGVAARFSDALKVDFENKKAMEAFQEQDVFHYQKEFEAGVGTYTLKVVFNGGQGFGKLEMPLVAESSDSKQLRMSGIAFSREFHKIAESELGLDAALIEDRTPLVAGGMQFTPTGASRFKKTDLVALYAQFYEGALLGANPPANLALAAQVKILDRKTREVKEDSGLMKVAQGLKPENSMVPVAYKLTVDKLAPGPYTVELTAMDTTGKVVKRVVDFDVQ